MADMDLSHMEKEHASEMEKMKEDLEFYKAKYAEHE